MYITKVAGTNDPSSWLILPAAGCYGQAWYDTDDKVSPTQPLLVVITQHCSPTKGRSVA